MKSYPWVVIIWQTSLWTSVEPGFHFFSYKESKIVFCTTWKSDLEGNNNSFVSRVEGCMDMKIFYFGINIFLVILSLLFQHIPGNFWTKDLFSQFSEAVMKAHSSTSWSHPINSLFLHSIVPITMFLDGIIFPAFS